MNYLRTATLALIISGCAAHTGVIPYESGSYLLARQAATGFTGAGTLKAEVVQEASAYCSASGKAVKFLSIDETKPPYVLGAFPRVEAHFTCS